MTQEAAVPAGYLDQVRRIAREEVAAAYRSGSMRNASIGEGGTFTIKGGQLRVLYPASLGGGVGVYFGDIGVGSTYVGTGLLIQDIDGSDLLSVRSDEATGVPLVVIRDGDENAVLYTNQATGDGFGRPWFEGALYPSRTVDWPTTSSATFETIYRGRISRQTSRLLVQTWAFSDTAGATGEVRVLVNGAQLGALGTSNNTAVTESLFYDDVAGAFGDQLSVEIQARLASGAGVVRVGAVQMQTRN